MAQTTLSSRVFAHSIDVFDCCTFATPLVNAYFLPIDLIKGCYSCVELNDSSGNPLPFTCIVPIQEFNFSLPSLDLNVREFANKKNSVLLIFPSLLWVVCALIFFAAMLWHQLISIHAFTLLSRLMRMGFCLQYLTLGQHIAFCLSGGSLLNKPAFSKRVHLKVASGTSVRALLYNNLIYCKTVSRPLISVGHTQGHAR